MGVSEDCFIDRSNSIHFTDKECAAGTGSGIICEDAIINFQNFCSVNINSTAALVPALYGFQCGIVIKYSIGHVQLFQIHIERTTPAVVAHFNKISFKHRIFNGSNSVGIAQTQSRSIDAGICRIYIDMVISEFRTGNRNLFEIGKTETCNLSVSCGGMTVHRNIAQCNIAGCRKTSTAAAGFDRGGGISVGAFIDTEIMGVCDFKIIRNDVASGFSRDPVRPIVIDLHAIHSQIAVCAFEFSIETIAAVAAGFHIFDRNIAGIDNVDTVSLRVAEHGIGDGNVAHGPVEIKPAVAVFHDHIVNGDVAGDRVQLDVGVIAGVSGEVGIRDGEVGVGGRTLLIKSVLIVVAGVPRNIQTFDRHFTVVGDIFQIQHTFRLASGDPDAVAVFLFRICTVDVNDLTVVAVVIHAQHAAVGVFKHGVAGKIHIPAEDIQIGISAHGSQHFGIVEMDLCRISGTVNQAL